MIHLSVGFPGDTDSKDSACNGGDPGTELGSPPLQTVKTLPAMEETQVQSLGQEDPLEKGMAICSSILA